MKFRTIRIENFHSFVDQEISLNSCSCFVGSNGAGKSTVLCALNVFFREQDSSGNGSLKMSGVGSNMKAKEAIKVGFDCFKANASRVSASVKVGDHDYHLHMVELHNTGPTNAMTLTTFTLCV